MDTPPFELACLNCLIMIRSSEHNFYAVTQSGDEWEITWGDVSYQDGGIGIAIPTDKDWPKGFHDGNGESLGLYASTIVDGTSVCIDHAVAHVAASEDANAG